MTAATVETDAPAETGPPAETEASAETEPPELSAAFGARFPWLSEVADEPVPFESFETPVQTALRRAQVQTWGDLAEMSEESLLAIPQVGTGTSRLVSEVLSRTSRSLYGRHLIASRQDSGGSEPADPDLAQRLPTAAQWARAATPQTTLGGLLTALYDGLPVPAQAVEEVERLLATPLPEVPTLPVLIEELLGEAQDPELLLAREFVRDRPTLESLGRERGVTRERIRQIVAADSEALRGWIRHVQYRPILWAIDRFQAEIGAVRRAESALVCVWRDRLGEPAFEALRWLSGYSYSYDDEWIYGLGTTARDLKKLLESTQIEDWLHLGGSVAKDLDRLLNETLSKEWLVQVEELVEKMPGLGDTAAASALLVGTGKWRDIGDGWLVRWDGPIQAKAERVLRLTCRPMTAEELVAAIGHGSARNLGNARRDRLVRIDKQSRLALPEWGIEKYESIAAEIVKRIKRGGGSASKSAIIDELTREYGVRASSVKGNLKLSVFAVSGDEVRLGDDSRFSARAPDTVPRAVQTEAGWGELRQVTKETLRGYSFAVNGHICWANGLKPGANLIVPLNGSKAHMASVIWRTTNTLRAVDVGRTRAWLKENGVGIGTEVLVCPTPERVTLYVGADEIEAARTA